MPTEVANQIFRVQKDFFFQSQWWTLLRLTEYKTRRMWAGYHISFSRLYVQNRTQSVINGLLCIAYWRIPKNAKLGGISTLVKRSLNYIRFLWRIWAWWLCWRWVCKASHLDFLVNFLFLFDYFQSLFLMLIQFPIIHTNH